MPEIENRNRRNIKDSLAANLMLLVRDHKLFGIPVFVYVVVLVAMVLALR